MRTRTTLPWLVLVITLLASGSAHADDTEKNDYSLWRSGVTKYELGEYEEAIKFFERAYAKNRNDDILYNLAQAHRQIKSYERALEYYRSYLRKKPNAPNRDQVEARIDEIKRLVDEQEAIRERPPPGVESPQGGDGGESLTASEDVATHAAVATGDSVEHKFWYQDRLGWAVTGVGLVGVGVGVGYFYSAGQSRDQIAGAASDSERQRLRDEAAGREAIGLPVVLAGTAVIGAGVYLLIRNPTPDGPRVSAGLSSDSAWVAIGGRF